MFSRSGICKDFISSLKPDEDSILLACSGGPDSAALIGACSVLIKRKIIKKAHVVHVNHNLRKEAIFDLNKCKEQASAFGIDFFSYDIYPGGKGENVYAEARKLRYSVFDNHALKFGLKTIATAHHADDVAETLIMNLARGCGLDGLCSVRKRNSALTSVPIIRPFLAYRKNFLEDLCKRSNVNYAIDKSNFNLEKTRSFIRHKVIPLLEEINPAFVEHSSKTSLIVQGVVEK